LEFIWKIALIVGVFNFEVRVFWFFLVLRIEAVQLASGVMCLVVSDLSRRCESLLLGNIGRQFYELFVKPPLMPRLLFISALTFFECICEPVDTLLHLSDLVA
jgi:hypothetical protein